MKTLLQINTNVGWNATGRIAEEIGRAAIDSGWRSYIAYGRDMDGSSLSASQLLKVGNRLDTYSHGLLTRMFDRHGLGSSKATKDLIRRIDVINPDVIHLHNIHGYYLNYVELFAYLARTNKPVVWTLHDCWPFTGHCAYFSLAQCDRWKTGCHSCPLKKAYPGSLMSDNSAANYELKKKTFTSLPNLHIVAVSERLSEVLRESFLNQFPIYTILNSVTIPRLHISKAKKPTVLAVASNWEFRKGLQYIIALRKLLPENVSIRVIGLNRSQIASLPEGCEGLPRINEREKLLKEFASASVFINPSLAETLSMVNIEALSCGTPLVAFDSGGMRETVNERSGIVVPTRNIEAMAEAIKTILAHPERFSSRECIRLATEKFSDKQLLGMYMQLYESLLPGMPLPVENITSTTSR
ncbi:MAG: glycosyltransferase [Muribaculaceae bacterium]|nr:glycosyltransferase [Muribaculaceae bacterium]